MADVEMQLGCRLAHGDDVERRDEAVEARERHLADRLDLDLLFDLGIKTLPIAA